MEQRIGSSSQPLEGAGFDPAFIPGLTSPVSGAGADAKASDTPESEAAGPEKAAAADSGEPAETAVAAEEEKTEAAEEPAEAGEAIAAGEAEEAESAEEAEETVPEGPVFEVSDRRAKIVADHRGVRLALDDQACEFRWDEIGAVETETARFGKRFTITVHTPDRRWYPIEIEASSRSRFAEWDERLDAVLDAYFEDGADEDAVAEEDAVADDADAETAAKSEKLEKTEKPEKSEKNAD
ncbi:hypothetical protein SLINC_5374 [Streptomyces lincolnensis]|uniref:Uncharacterized protein n=1 Tax=Streptomyces lincolnensis TaxID=1915 RepID=A0A1B1MG68_STRLN|nr:hypothetical protein [Streptomyces lincolnensis]ANS67598.1 hypothetical protein SLINC_5374 [Streptomyces lincolnensis]AXG54913.1 hypothetical protein SLCG_3758 [Streptomyces lincolnensis]QMV09263.1 hypothetical protein GJU35_28860 [Streptomyces lincolnensis]